MQSTDEARQVTLGERQKRLPPEAATACVLFRTLCDDPELLAGASDAQVHAMLEAMQAARNDSRARRARRARQQRYARWERLLLKAAAQSAHMLVVDLQPREDMRWVAHTPARILHAEPVALAELAHKTTRLFVSFSHHDLRELYQCRLPIVSPWR
jgi:hypothetical protein